MLGAIITPTDPVVASSIVTGKHAHDHVPAPLRTTISLESGANDGLSYLFVFIPILLLQHSAAGAVQGIFVDITLRRILGGAALGLLMGWVAAPVASWAEQNQKAGASALFVFSSALAITVLSAADLLGLNGILAVFLAGLAFEFHGARKEAASPEEVQTALDLLFTVPTFVLIGLLLPWKDWIAFGWRGVGFALGLFLFRRFPVVLLMRPILGKWFDGPRQLILAWAGPIGTSTAFYAMLAARELAWHEVWTFASLALAASVLLHSVTAAHIVRYFGQKERPLQS